MVNNVRVNAEFSAIPFSLQLMFNQSFSNLIAYLMISQNLHTKVAQMSYGVAVETR